MNALKRELVNVTVHSFYRCVGLSGLWDKIMKHLIKVTREKVGRTSEPTNQF